VTLGRPGCSAGQRPKDRPRAGRRHLPASTSSAETPPPTHPHGGAADERSESITHRRRVLLAQVDLVGLSIQAERNRFGSFTAIEVINQPDLDNLSHLLFPSMLVRRG
jgi:hypothetical protein